MDENHPFFFESTFLFVSASSSSVHHSSDFCLFNYIYKDLVIFFYVFFTFQLQWKLCLHQFLLFCFLVQKFGTARASFLFSPIMGAWTLTTPFIGIYNIIYHYPSIFKAISPHYIYQFFSRNGHEGWLLLNGMVLCITGKSFLPFVFFIFFSVKFLDG